MGRPIPYGPLGLAWAPGSGLSHFWVDRQSGLRRGVKKGGGKHSNKRYPVRLIRAIIFVTK